MKIFSFTETQSKKDKSIKQLIRVECVKIKEGEPIKVLRYRGGERDYHGIIEKIRDTNTDPVEASSLEFYDRSRFLITVKLDEEVEDSTGKLSNYRSFYTDFLEDVR